MGPRQNLIGRKFGKLTVIGLSDRTPAGRQKWICECECGGKRSTTGGNLKRGMNISCGCVKPGPSSHGHCVGGETPTYRVWNHMRSRCQNTKSQFYRHYGGRGISVCERWQRFENFLQDMGPRPDGLSLDRIDNNGNYEPENCRWATNAHQQLNKRTSRLLTAHGKTQNLSLWADEYGIRRPTLAARLGRGIPLEIALKTVRR